MIERRPRWRRMSRTALRVLVIVALGIPILLAGTAASGFGMLLFSDLPGTVPEPNPQIESQPSYVYDAYGTQIGSFRKFDVTVEMTKDDVPEVLEKAVISAEDRNFWTHRGIDPQGLFRAAWTNYEEGETVQGGSTITQQYVKATYLSAERTVTRKLNEAVLATRVERDLTDELGSTRAAKEEILYRYLDRTYFGGGAYGAGAAAETYFHKNVRDLTLSEAALLAGVIPSPSLLGPRDNPFAAETVRSQVLDDMLETAAITQAEYDDAIARPVWYLAYGPAPTDQSYTIVHQPPVNGATNFPYFVDYVREYLIERYGPEIVDQGGLRIETTLDPFMQNMAETSVAQGLGNTSYPLEMSLVSIEPSTGFVRAFVGGRDFAQSQVNLGLGGSSGMQAGSSFKTFTVATALERGYTPETSYGGSGGWSIPGCTDPVGCSVRGGSGGTMRSATASSSNVYFAQLAYDVGADKIAEMANRLGVSRIGLDRSYGLSITFGAYTVSPLDMAAGYSTIANHGTRLSATPVVKVVRPDGTTLEDNTSRVGEQVLDPAIADTTTDMLRGVIDGGTGKSANIGRPAAGKTGSADENKAAWFVGYTPQLVTAVWMGYADKPQPLRNINGVGEVFGGTIPAKTWATFMKQAMEGRPVMDFTPPGPLPMPGQSVTVEPARRKAQQRPVGTIPNDCGGPCVQSPSLPAPSAPTTTTTTAATTTTVGGPADESAGGSTTTTKANTP